MIRNLSVLTLLFLLPVVICRADDKPHRRRAYNTIALDFPADGGIMLMGSRMWRVTRHLDAGFVFGGGEIQRDFELDNGRGGDYQAETKSFIFPFAGPQLSLNFGWIGIAVGYAAFHAKTDLSVKTDSFGTLTGTTKDWGSGFYSPLLVLDFYDSKHDLVFGVGLGGFLGMQFADLEASNDQAKITTDESPLDTLTFHVRMMWADGRWKRMKERKAKEEEF